MTNSQDSSNLFARTWREVSRRHPEDSYAWMMANRTLMGRPLEEIHPLRQIMCDQSPLIVIQKSAQVGVTEAMVTKALWAASTGYAQRGHVMYFMPTDPQMRDFAQTRIDQAIQGSAYLEAQLRPAPPRRGGADSTRIKQFPNGAMYMRGSESWRSVASVDADLVVLDEFDQMHDGILERALRRVSSSRAGQVIVLSTPRFPETGVNALFLRSDQHRYFLTCRACGLEQFLTFAENVDIVSALIVCGRCRDRLDLSSPGRWIAMAPGNAIRGYHLNRLYSLWCNLPAMIEASDAPGVHAIQTFWNEDLGEVYAPSGSFLSLDDLDRCRTDAATALYRGAETVMGVDVGNKNHVVVRRAPDRRERIPSVARPRRDVPAHHIDTDTRRPPPGLYPEYWEPPRGRPAVEARASGMLYAAEVVSSFEEIDALMARYNVRSVVVDAQPETRAAQQFADRHPGKVQLARYDRHDASIERDREGRTRFVHADRTYVMDRMVEAFRNGTALLPPDARSLGGRVRQGVGEYYRQMQVSKRVVEHGPNGPVARWLDGGRDDHFAHAEVYAMLAAS